jgi:hypothetical protein
VAIAEVTYAILKNTCGQFVLQDLLEKRQEIADDIEKQVDHFVSEWGVDVNLLSDRSKRSSSRTFNSARNSRTRFPARQRREDWQRARSSQLAPTWNPPN